MTYEIQAADSRVKRKVWRFRESVITYAVMLLISGVHAGLVILVIALDLPDVIKALVPLIYWALMAAVFTLITNRQIKNSYDAPMQSLSRAAKDVASGDFSVYMQPRHTEDKLDYIDAMYLDFNKMVEALGSMETMKTEFFSNVSHEMKAPLAVLSSSLELMETGCLSEEEERAQLKTAISAARRMSGLVENLLKLNRLENQTIVPKTDSYDVCAQLCECAIGFEALWEEKNIDFEAELEDEAWAAADEELMRIVWNNLLSNAVKFTPDEGTIRLQQISEGGRIIVSVSDTGCGMDEETRSRIFEKFYQGDTSHAQEGNGLGLSLVKRILQLSDGEISVSSSPGKGSVFTVSIPAGAPPEEKGF